MNNLKLSRGRLFSLVLIYGIVTLVTISCMVPIINLFAISLSSSQAIVENRVGLFPVEFSLKAYQYVLNNEKFWTSSLVSLKRVLIGLPLNLIMTILVGYPLSKSERAFPARKYYVAYMLVVMLFNGGMMPTYFIVSKTGLIDTIWALLIPGAVPIFSCIILMNFFRDIPEQLEEVARLDGANQFQIMTQIFLPLSKPSLATIALFSLVGHWNSWFDGLIYSNHTQNYPLQSYLQTLVASNTEALLTGDIKTYMDMVNVNDTNMKAAQIFISIIPLMAIYPFLQKNFTTGLTVGSVKE